MVILSDRESERGLSLSEYLKSLKWISQTVMKKRNEEITSHSQAVLASLEFAIKDTC